MVMLKSVCVVLPKIHRKHLFSTILARRKCSSDTQSSRKIVEPGEIVVSRQRDVGLVGINRPSVQNCLTDDLTVRLFAEIERIEEDPSILVGVLHGIGGTFCAGHDLNSISESTFSRAPRITRRFLRKPFVCAMNGFCVGNGLELALMCDLRVIEETCVIGFLNRRFGVPLIDGGTVRLPALIGLSRALDMVLTGRKVSAEEAFEMGLASRFVANGTGVGQAVHLAVAVAKFPQNALLHDRTSMYRATFDGTSFDAAVKDEIESVTPEMVQEAIQGSRRFAEGIGKSGKFHDIKARPIADWEADEIAREKTKSES
ncbi:2,3-dehydroadipyl-CoA hydratase-like [Phlebotomus argentipes]|uniref:2,3-dehydroadipyl-CoA hydratase-like n=1 Tax=Phlebotomus argentipes TaxID=94469 RepID=UPI002892AD42|nr:2,3-dehydroadipyl-CoA hydratase-like [Phlebotomus argentipes]